MSNFDPINSEISTESEGKKGFLSRKYLVFKLNDNTYGVPLSDVKEVIGMPTMVPVPQSPNYLLGLINLRGRVISAIDLKTKLGMGKGTDVKRPAMILVEGDVTVMGCVVDAISEVLSIKEDEIERQVKENVPVSTTYIQGIARFTDKPMILLLDLKKATDLGEFGKTISRAA
jgi:purine-binding chemotaxis protein CheW